MTTLILQIQTLFPDILVQVGLLATDSVPACNSYTRYPHSVHVLGITYLLSTKPTPMKRKRK